MMTISVGSSQADMDKQQEQDDEDFEVAALRKLLRSGPRTNRARPTGLADPPAPDVPADDHIQKIMAVFASKENIDHFARSVPVEEVAENDYNLSVSSYVEAEDTREVVDITQLNAELKTTVAKITQLRSEIDAIVAQIEGEGTEA